jgi:hypothetical protein
MRNCQTRNHAQLPRNRPQLPRNRRATIKVPIRATAATVVL